MLAMQPRKACCFATTLSKETGFVSPIFHIYKPDSAFQPRWFCRQSLSAVFVFGYTTAHHIASAQNQLQVIVYIYLACRQQGGTRRAL